ncbi:hypothetical protein B0H10DRAFT_2163799 [Mycena sp. CBHHK59/15]|nr:hypothetical protein B0H10DRAFT_2163799 [Mycena sp. CBHHK59/15]
MFTKFALQLISISAIATGVFASPISIPEDTELVSRGRSHGSISFNNWQGHQSLNNFDNFYGVDNFDGYHRTQNVVKDHEVVCHSQTIEIIQQRLVVLQEMAKRIITEQICEVETQVIVFQQYYSSLGNFHGDLRRYSGHQVGYDNGIVSHFKDFYNSDGSFTTHDWGFSGRDVGSQTIVVGDSNWDDHTSHSSVDSAYYTARNAYYFNHFDI